MQSAVRKYTNLMCLNGMKSIYHINQGPIRIEADFTFLNSEAHFLIVVEIGGGSVVWSARTADTPSESK
jgi:hypothetical protein